MQALQNRTLAALLDDETWLAHNTNSVPTEKQLS